MDAASPVPGRHRRPASSRRHGYAWCLIACFLALVSTYGDPATRLAAAAVSPYTELRPADVQPSAGLRLEIVAAGDRVEPTWADHSGPSAAALIAAGTAPEEAYSRQVAEALASLLPDPRFSGWASARAPPFLS